MMLQSSVTPMSCKSEIPRTQQQLDRQREQLGTVAKTVEGTVLVLNSHTGTLMKTVAAEDTLLSVLKVYYAHTQLVTMLMSDRIRKMLVLLQIL